MLAAVRSNSRSQMTLLSFISALQIFSTGSFSLCLSVGMKALYVALFFMLVMEVNAGNSWVPSSSFLNPARATSAILFYNDSFLIVGGCLDVGCQQLSRSVSKFDAETTQLEDLAPLPISISVNGLEPEPVGFAGYYSTIAVGTYNQQQQEITTHVWIIGACSLHFGHTMTSVEREKYRLMWSLEHDLLSLRDAVEVPSHVPTRVNASCASFAGNIYIIGGVIMETGEVTSSVNIYNVQTDTFTEDAFHHEAAVMNAAVTVDNKMLYIAGGQNVAFGHISSDHGARVSTKVRGYVWSPFLFLNSSAAFEKVIRFPDNEHLANTSAPASSLMRAFFELPRVFAFAGTLVMIISTAHFSTLNIVGSSTPLNTSSWNLETVEGTNTLLSTVVGFPYLDSFRGTRLTFYSFGGVSIDGHGDIKVLSSIYFRFTSMNVPGPLGKLPSIIPEDDPLFLQLGPPVSSKCYAQLSPDVVCYLPIWGTSEIPVSSNWTIIFWPLPQTKRVYLCVGVRSSRPEIQGTFFAATDPYHSFSIVESITPIAPPTPQPTEGPSSSTITQTNNTGTLIFGVVLCVLVVLGGGGACVAFHRAKIQRARLEDSLLDDSGDQKTDSLVRNTTSDSRYRVIRRIGAGSFSTVFLVARKTDGEQFALKFMACADDRERLDAIKECETINSLQGHPNVITLYDMFMSYEFERRDSVLSDEGKASDRILAAHRESSLNDPNGYGTLGGSPSTPNLARGRSRSDSIGSKGSSGSQVAPLPVHNRYLCLVMEYHPAGDLAHWVLNSSFRDEGGGGLSEATIISVAYQMCSVLKHLHSQRPPVVHRDLKPENVLLRGSPSHQDTYLPIVVTDFGLAFIQEENRKGGKGGGTRPYIAPECWKGNVSTASDIWSLGCVLYAVATQRVTADTVRVMFLDAKSPHFHDDIQYDLRVHRYSEKFSRFVASLLVVDPKQRPTAAEVLTRFTAVGDSARSAVRLS